MHFWEGAGRAPPWMGAVIPGLSSAPQPESTAKTTQMRTRVPEQC